MGSKFVPVINPMTPDTWVASRFKSNPKLYNALNGKLWKAGRVPEGAKYPFLLQSKVPQGVDKALGGKPRLAIARFVIRAVMRADYLPAGQTHLSLFLCPQGQEGIVQEIQRTYCGVHDSTTSSGHVWASDFEDFYEAEYEDKGIDTLEMGVKVLVYFT